jgi:hypothetical protein
MEPGGGEWTFPADAFQFVRKTGFSEFLFGEFQQRVGDIYGEGNGFEGHIYLEVTAGDDEVGLALTIPSLK